MPTTIDDLGPPRWATRTAKSPRPARALRGWLARLWGRLGPRSNTTLALAPPPGDLTELDPRLLADIGAPESWQAHARARREARAEERAGLHAGLASDRWRHW